jgi:glycosyl transferase family 25
MRLVKLSLLLLAGLFCLALCIPVGYFVLNDSENKLVVKEPVKSAGFVSYVINLDRSQERLDYITPNLHKLNFPVQRIAAVDGYKLTTEEIAKIVDLNAYHNLLDYPLRVGVVGCALSHIKAWETFLASPYEYAIIFEDDVLLVPEEVKKIAQDLANNPQYWDIVNLTTDHRGIPLTLKKFADNSSIVVYLTRTTNAGAYVINRHAAKQLLSKALPIVLPNDLYFARGWELGLKYTGIEPRPNIVIENMFTLQTNIIRFMYNLWLYLCNLVK